VNLPNSQPDYLIAQLQTSGSQCSPPRQRRKTDDMFMGALNSRITATKTSTYRPADGEVINGWQFTSSSGPCIDVGANKKNIVITNSIIGPCGTNLNEEYGVIVREGSYNITIQNNEIKSVSTGVYGARDGIVIDRNLIYGIRGPSFATTPKGWDGQAVAFHSVGGVPPVPSEEAVTHRSRITCNVSDALIPAPNKNYEDHISVFKSKGSPRAPIEIAYNRLRGGTSKSGGGITVGDQGGEWIWVHDNYIQKVANGGIGVVGGHNILVESNDVDNRGESAETLTSYAFFVRPFVACSNVTLRNNRGNAVLWAWNGGSTANAGYIYLNDKGYSCVPAPDTGANNNWTYDFPADSVYVTPDRACQGGFTAWPYP
jgi:hypothetical protein